MVAGFNPLAWMNRSYAVGAVFTRTPTSEVIESPAESVTVCVNFAIPMKFAFGVKRAVLASANNCTVPVPADEGDSWTVRVGDDV